MRSVVFSAVCGAVCAAAHGPLDGAETPSPLPLPQTAANSSAAGLSGPPARLPPPTDEIPLQLPTSVRPGETPWQLSELEELAQQANPAVARAAALAAAARGAWLQAGLPPNPTAGYVSSEVGNDGRAGQQGVYFGQEFVRGNKLGLSRAVEDREVARLIQEWEVARLRVITDVRLRYYEALVAQRLLEVTGQLRETSEAAVRAAQALLAAGEGRRTDLLQAEVEAQRAAVRRQQAQVASDAARRRLAAVVAAGPLGERRLEGELIPPLWTSDWNATLAQLLATSPEIAAATAAVQRAERVVQRERVQPIPNIDAQGLVQYDYGSEYAIAGVQAGLALPIWNRNQGGVQRAQAELIAARRNLERVELGLQERLAQAWSQYEQARARVEALERGMLQRSAESLTLVRRGYEAGEISYVELLTAQRTAFETNLEYLEAVGELNAGLQLLRGNLLFDSLGAETAP